VIHVGLPADSDYPKQAHLYTAILHTTLLNRFDLEQGVVNGWRMTVDMGMTLLVPGEGVHGDRSLISLADAANRPAKHLYAQTLDQANENLRQLKRFHRGVYNTITERFDHSPMETVTDPDMRQRAIALTADTYSANLVEAINTRRQIQASAAPISPAGSGLTPSAEHPHVYFGWVMRADLDGFTALVKKCNGQPDQLQELARKFVRVMRACADFISQHDEVMAQLPWAGDNFTAAVVFRDKEDYQEARPERIVSHVLDFGKELGYGDVMDGLGEWAFGVAGGEIHGNASGNVFIGAVNFQKRRFLVGAGRGVYRSLQAFADLKPDARNIVILNDDYTQLESPYKNCFGTATKPNGQNSSLFKLSPIEDLEAARLEPSTYNRSVSVTTATGAAAIAVKPFCDE
jgi:hypothetical protein